MIDRTKPLTEQDPSDLRVLIDALHGNRERYDRANRIVEARSCELEIAEATRALAILNRRATEAEDQRAVVASGQPVLTADEVRAVVRKAWPYSEMTAGLREATANAIAEKLAGRAVSSEQRDRIVTIADEAFGLGPVEPLDETLTRIEHGIFEQHRTAENELSDLRRRLAAATAASELVTAERDTLRAQREADLRDAFLDGMAWAYGRSRISIDQSRDQAAAEYARSKVGG